MGCIKIGEDEDIRRIFEFSVGQLDLRREGIKCDICLKLTVDLHFVRIHLLASQLGGSPNVACRRSEGRSLGGMTQEGDPGPTTEIDPSKLAGLDSDRRQLFSRKIVPGIIDDN